MKKVIFSLALLATSFTAINAVASANQYESAEKGKILVVDDSRARGLMVDESTGETVEFVNPDRIEVIPGDSFDFMRVLQSTPNGSKVINILKVRVPN